jgi:hypothetical protein
LNPAALTLLGLFHCFGVLQVTKDPSETAKDVLLHHLWVDHQGGTDINYRSDAVLILELIAHFQRQALPLRGSVSERGPICDVKRLSGRFQLGRDSHYRIGRNGRRLTPKNP